MDGTESPFFFFTRNNSLMLLPRTECMHTCMQGQQVKRGHIMEASVLRPRSRSAAWEEGPPDQLLLAISAEAPPGVGEAGRGDRGSHGPQLLAGGGHHS